MNTMDTAIVDTVAQIFRGGSSVAQDPYPLFARVREEAPLLRAPGSQRGFSVNSRGFWNN